MRTASACGFSWRAGSRRSLGAARRPRRRGAGSCSRRPRGSVLRDRPRRPAPLLAPAEIARALRVRIVERRYSEADRRALVEAGLHPVLARVYAGRQIHAASELQYDPALLAPPEQLKNAAAAARLLADAIASGRRLLIVADYDADGATACAVGMRALRAMGGYGDYLVPHR